MILKSLSVFAVSAALGAVSAAPLSAQRPNAAQQQSGRSSAPAKSSPAGSQTPAPQRPKPWWADPNSQKELGLTPEQVKAIDDIYNSSKDELATYRDNVDRERKELDRMIAESKVEQWQVLRQIDRMETARSNNNKTFYMMLYRMNRQLTAEQRAKLQDMERRAREGRGGTIRDPKAGR